MRRRRGARIRGERARKGKTLYRRYQILIYAFLLVWWTAPAAAQVEFEGTQLSMGANISTGYSGDFDGSGIGGSAHGWGVGGNGSMQGFYYNPNFLSFTVQPYYNRAQSDATAGSIFDTSGYNANVSLFSGSHFPGNINFNQNWNSTGTYGIPGLTGPTTKNNNRNLGIAWSEMVPDLPTVTVSFSHSSGSSSLLGSTGQSDVTSDSFGIHSGYRIHGWSLGGGFTHLGVNANVTSVLQEEGTETTNTSSNSFGVSAGHSLALIKGGFGVGFSRTDYNSGFDGGSSNGTTDNANGNLNFAVWRFPITATTTYTDNLYGSFQQQLLANGQTGVLSNISPESRSLLTNVFTSYHLMPHVFVNGYLSNQEMYLQAQTYSNTQFGGNISFGFDRMLKGLTVSIGANDTANQEGNQGAGLVANVNYTGSVGHWEFGANFGYDQNVQTMFAIYQSSSLSYGLNIHRRLFNGLSWSLGGGGGHSGFVQVPGTGSSGQMVNTALSWHKFTAGGNYSRSSGTSVVTPTGLVSVPAPVVSNTVVYTGSGYGYGFGGSIVRGLSFSASHSQANSQTQGQMLASTLPFANSTNSTEVTTGILTYQFRKVYFNASAIQFRQSISASATAPTRFTSYYFGISRWFKIF